MTAQEVKKIEYPGSQNEIVEEQMDPPSFTRKFLAIEMKKLGTEIDDDQTTRFQQVIREKEQKILEKMGGEAQDLVPVKESQPPTASREEPRDVEIEA